MNSDRVAVVLLSHESAANVARMRQAWEALGPAVCVVAYGGPVAEFERIEGDKVFIDDPRLRTRDHQREFQSYSGVFRAALDFLADKNWDWLFFAEYDLVPISTGLLPGLLAEAEKEDADLLGAGASRLDNTLHVHHSAHAATNGWSGWIRSISRREDPAVVLSCLGCGQLWRRKTIEAVVAAGEPIESYLEILLPTVAHHLGFRVRPWKSHSKFILPDPLPSVDTAYWRTQGASAVHPIKGYWDEASS